MPKPLNRVTIEGFRSIRELRDLSLGKLNVLVGANGAGKSNFVEFFRLLRAMSERRLQAFVHESGGADGFCFGGPKLTPSIKGHLVFGANEYRFELKPSPANELRILSEGVLYGARRDWQDESGARPESHLKSWAERKSKHADLQGYDDYPSVHAHVAQAVRGWVVYHVHDTSNTAPMRRIHPVSNFRELQSDAGNVAPFLRWIRENHPLCYRRILETIRLVAPFLDDFLLDIRTAGQNESTLLEWRQQGSPFPYQPWQLSDGTIRFVCLAVALLQPNPPSTVVIDEPELGLHPFALDLLANLIHEAADRTQVIVSTQSPSLLSKFDPENVLVVDREGGASRFRRLDTASLAHWLDDYSLGELLQKNVVEASPRYES